MKALSKDWAKILICSDLHSVFLDKKAFAVMLGVITENKFEKIYINGDLMDMTLISEHTPKIKRCMGGDGAKAFLSKFTLEYEVAFTKKHILEPMRKTAKKTPIIYRTAANHEIRYTAPGSMNTKAMRMIMETEETLGVRRGNMHDLLDLGKYKIDIDERHMTHLPSDSRKTLMLTHGSTAVQTAPKRNLEMYKMSGISSHTHRMGMHEEQSIGMGEKFIWCESGHLRTQTNVEYLDKPPNWQQGFLVVYMRRDGKFEIQRQQIHKYSTIFNGCLYTP